MSRDRLLIGTDQGGLGPDGWNEGSGDFSTAPFSPALDAVLSGNRFTWLYTPVTLTIGGLTPGQNYRLQLLFANNLNTTGNTRK